MADRLKRWQKQESKPGLSRIKPTQLNRDMSQTTFLYNNVTEVILLFMQIIKRPFSALQTMQQLSTKLVLRTFLLCHHMLYKLSPLWSKFWGTSLKILVATNFSFLENSKCCFSFEILSSKQKFAKFFLQWPRAKRNSELSL